MKPVREDVEQTDRQQGLIPPEHEVHPPSHLAGMIESGEVVAMEVYGDEILKAPVTDEPCLYWWLEIAHETPKANYHLLTRIGKNSLYVKAEDVFVEVDRTKRRCEPDFVKKYMAGEEPRNAPHPSHEYPDVTYRLWLIKPGQFYPVRVEKFGSALPPRKPGDRPRFETYYHFTFG